MDGVFDLKRELEAAAGMRPVDIIFDNLILADVYTDEIRPGSLAVFNGRIVAVDPASDAECKERIDCKGRYAVPGFMDAHVHIETTLLTPEALGDAISPWGTTSLFVDTMEIANVAGEAGLLAFIENAEDLPFRFLLEIPSRVPTAPGLETTGGVLGVTEVKRLLKLPQSVSLGELDPSKILGIREEYLEKVLSALNAGKICNGHAIGLNPAELNIYATGHLMDDHESVTYEELIQRLRVGVKALVREGSSERNLEALMKGVIHNGLSTENLMFCTDDKHVNDIFREGHISYNIQKCIDMGMEPLAAIKIATINTAKHFRMDHELGSLAPGRYADIVFLDDLSKIVPAQVYKSGRLIAENGHAVGVKSKKYPTDLFHTVYLPKNLGAASFCIKTGGKRALCRVVSLIQDQIINKEETAWIEALEGKLNADTDRDILKLAVVERYAKNGKVSNAFVHGFELKHGAIASSVSHDHHNIVVAGCNENDMLIAVQEIERMQGGFVAVDKGMVTGALELPLAGLMSTLTAAEVMGRMDKLNETVRSLGCRLDAPFMSLSFISLPTVPALGLTDYGLIDVLGHRIVDVILEIQN